MAKRMFWMLGAVALFLAAIAFAKFRQIQAATSQSAYEPPPEAVTTIVAKQQPWEQTIASIGTVSAVQGVTVTADLSGLVDKILFESGRTVRAGEILIRLDTRQESAQLAAAQAQRELDDLNLERTRGLREQGITSQADYDRAIAEAKQAAARVGEISATIARKTIRAPFSGILGIRQVNLGQYLQGGDPIVPLQSLDPIQVDFGVPQEALRQIAVGREVRVLPEGQTGGGAIGKISAVNSIVDAATRNVHIQSTLDNPKGLLRPGMFVKVTVVLPAQDTVVTLPASAIRYAPYGNSVFIVEERKNPQGKTYRGVRQEFVKLGSERGDQIAVLSGVKEGEEVVTSGVFKLRNGAAVLVNNEVQPSNQAAPKPEDS